MNLSRLPWDAGQGDDVVIRESARSRRLLLRVHDSAQVEVVVPRGTPLRLVERFVGSHLDWIAARVARARAHARPPEPFPPQRLEFAACGEQWRVQPVGGAGLPRARCGGPGLLLLTGAAEPQAQREALRRWVLVRARELLPPLLAEVSASHGLRHTGVQVRLQRTRWGSCSARSRISLNAALLFQPPEVVRYLCVHELAHTRHLNHSRHFWALVAECEPGFARLDAQLRQGWRNVPDWLRPSRRVIA